MVILAIVLRSVAHFDLRTLFWSLLHIGVCTHVVEYRNHQSRFSRVAGIYRIRFSKILNYVTYINQRKLSKNLPIFHKSPSVCRNLDELFSIKKFSRTNNSRYIYCFTRTEKQILRMWGWLNEAEPWNTITRGKRWSANVKLSFAAGVM